MIYASGRHGLQRGFADYTYYPLVEGHHVASLVHDVTASAQALAPHQNNVLSLA